MVKVDVLGSCRIPKFAIQSGSHLAFRMPEPKSLTLKHTCFSAQDWRYIRAVSWLSCWSTRDGGLGRWSALSDCGKNRLRIGMSRRGRGRTALFPEHIQSKDSQKDHRRQRQ